MITIIIAGILVWPCIKYMERKEEHPLDDWVIFGLVLGPAAMIWILSFVQINLGVSPLFLLLALSLYFLVPAVALRNIMEYTWKRSCAYGGVVFTITFVVQICVELWLAI